MQNIKSTPFLLLLVLILLCFASCTSKSEAVANARKEQTSKQEVIEDKLVKAQVYKSLRAQHVNSEVITNVVVHEDDDFQSGDIIWTKFDEKQQALKVLYDYNVDIASTVGMSMFKVKIL